MKNAVVYIDYNFQNPKYRNRPEDGEAYFTYGFGSLYARKFKEEFPDWEVQCWKADKHAGKIESFEKQGVKHIVFPATRLSRAGYFSASLQRHARKFIKNHPRAAFNISSFDHLLHFQISRFGKKCPVFVQHHGESPARYKIKNSSGFKNIYWRFWSFIEDKAFARTSMLYLLDLDASRHLKLTKTDFKISTTGVDPELFKPIEKKDARKRLGLNENSKFLLFIGRLNLSKRADMLISAFLKLKLEFPELVLLIGGCQSSDALYEMARNSGAIVTGTIPQHEVSVWLSAADVYSLPLLDQAHIYGGIGMLPVQALFCNTPVVGSTLKCFPDDSKDQVGVFSNSEDTLVIALRDILSGKKGFSNIRDLALNHFSWSSISRKTARDYINAIDSLCR